MQNLSKYRNYINQPPSSNNYYKHLGEILINKFITINEKLLSDPPLMSFSIRSLTLYDRTFSRKDVPFLRALSKIFRVKIMWIKTLNRITLQPVQTISLVGEEERVFIFNHWLNHYLNYEDKYREWIKLNKRKEFETLKSESTGIPYKTIRSFSSYLIENLRKTIIDAVEPKLEYDVPYILWLEDCIKIKFKLDYKAYKTEKHEYYHAVSLTPYNRRMLI
jgi:hypothetical protein